MWKAGGGNFGFLISDFGLREGALLRPACAGLRRAPEVGGAPATGGNVDMGRWRFLYGLKFRPEDGIHPGSNPTVEGAIP